MKIIKYITLPITLLLLLSSANLEAQKPSNMKIGVKLKTAEFYRKGFLLELNYSKAFEIYKVCADSGNAKAMNSLGIMHLEGMGVEKNSEKAISYFTESARNGYAKAQYNLGLMYKNGDGVRRDFTKAYMYFRQSAEAGYTGGMYATGYFLYRGFGVEQNYEEAVKWFTKGALGGSYACQFHLGLCYRNGYGTSKDEKKANELLRQASKNGYSLAKIEREIKEPENKKTEISPQQRSNKLGNRNREKVNESNVEDLVVPQIYRKVYQQKNISLEGNWKGKLITYDWSGKHILSTTELELSVVQEKDKIKGSWVEGVEGDTIELSFEGIITDSKILYSNASYVTKTRYSDARSWEFQNGSFSVVEENGKLFLEGNIQKFSPETLEPHQPTHLKLEYKNSTIKEPIHSPSFKVYPNPVEKQVNIEFTVEEPSDVTVEIFSLQGVFIKRVSLGSKDTGTFDVTLDADFNPGVYLLRLIQKNNTYGSIILKN